MLIILFDWKYTKESKLEFEFRKRGLDYKIYSIPNYNLKDRTVKLRILNLYYKYLLQAYSAVKSSKVDDIIICWNFTSSIAVGWISKILFKKRKIIALNIIAPDLKEPFESIRNFIFHFPMKLKYFVITVNSKDYISYYSRKFYINKNKFFELPDSFKTTKAVINNKDKGYIFCGGEAKRDWETLFKACQILNSKKFICVARRKYFKKTLKIPPNVKMFYDIKIELFNTLLNECSIVTLPLSTQLPAGLIILLSSATNYKPIVATSTPAIRNYITDGISGFLFEQEDYKTLAYKLDALINNPEMQTTFSNNLYNYVKSEYNIEKYTAKLISIIKTNFNYTLK